MKNLILIFITLISCITVLFAQEGVSNRYPADLVFDYQVTGSQTYIATNSIRFILEHGGGIISGNQVQSYEVITSCKDDKNFNLSNTKTSINKIEILNGIKINPNPFSNSTTIDYSISKSGKVKITLLNSINIKLFELINETQAEGSHQVILNGSKLNSGIYYILFESDNFRKVEKIVLVK